MSQNTLNDVQPQFNFWVCDGKVVKNLQELQYALDKMSEGTYTYHANNAKNDFANWVNDIIKHPELAQQLRKVKSRQIAAKVVERTIKTAKRK